MDRCKWTKCTCAKNTRLTLTLCLGEPLQLVFYQFLFCTKAMVNSRCSDNILYDLCKWNTAKFYWSESHTKCQVPSYQILHIIRQYLYHPISYRQLFLLLLDWGCTSIRGVFLLGISSPTDSGSSGSSCVSGVFNSWRLQRTYGVRAKGSGDITTDVQTLLEAFLIMPLRYACFIDDDLFW